MSEDDTDCTPTAGTHDAQMPAAVVRLHRPTSRTRQENEPLAIQGASDPTPGYRAVVAFDEVWTNRSDDEIDWDRIVGVLDHLPPGNQPGTWRDTDKLSRHEWHGFDRRYGQAIMSWMEACYDEAALITFDWSRWTDHWIGQRFLNDPHAVRDADLHTLRMALTTHLRGDHWVDGHLFAIAEDGTLRLLLEEIRTRCIESGLVNEG